MLSISSLASYKPMFIVELTAAILLYSWALRRRKFFPLRALGGGIVILLAAVAAPIPRYDGITLSILFLTMFLEEVVYLVVCYDEPFANIFFCAVCGFTTQHLASAIYNLIMVITNLDDMQLIGYGTTVQSTGTDVWGIFSILIYIDVYFIVYWLLYCFFGHRMQRGEDLRLSGWTSVAIAGLIIAGDVVLNALAVGYNYASPDRMYMGIQYAYSILSCLLLLLFLFGLISSKRLTREKEIMQELMAAQQRQYTIAKDNIDRINIKCHDLKHQIHEIAGRSAMNEEEMQEIERVISIYDAAVKTGNEALDTILTEKSLQCNANGIRITCMADGDSLAFMRESDIYTLFGNAVDNAIEAVMKLRDPEKRVIGLKVKKSGGFVLVHIYNYYAGELRMKDGRPVTSKEDRGEHGFGVRSMQQITERYGGSLKTEPQEDVFNLSVVFPV